MTQASIFGAIIVGTAFVMAIIVLCFAWSVLKQHLSFCRQTNIYRRNAMEDQTFTLCARVVGAAFSFCMYLLLVTLMFLFNAITVKLFLGGLVFSAGLGLVIYNIITTCRREIEQSLNNIKIKL